MVSNPSRVSDSADESISRDDLQTMYRLMARIREFETVAARLLRNNEIPGFLHLSVGQEATAVGACWYLGDHDGITSTHRGHGHCLAKGLEPEPMFAELMGKETGTCRGRGGSMHIADPRVGVFGANGIVGAGLPIAAGVATASQIREDSRVTVGFFGDGAAAQGNFHEAVNLAVVWNLPVIFFCENNQYSEFAPVEDQHGTTLDKRAIGYGIDYHEVDGNDVVAVAELMRSLIAGTRNGDGPVLVEAHTYRWFGHYEGDPQRYRPADELEQWKERDPLLVLRSAMAAAGIESDTADRIDSEVQAEIENAIESARNAPMPSTDTLFDFVWNERPELPEPAEPAGEEFKTMHAVREAITYELQTDPSVFLAGIDVGKGGNVFALFRGLADQYPGRVRDTPISESAIVGTAVGAAMAGMRPIVEIMYMDFLGVCLDQIMNQAAKLRFMTGGTAALPLVVRTQYAAGRSSGAQHSQSLEALLAHIPGLTVVMPSTPSDAYGLLRASIRDLNPVVFVENRLQYGMKGARPEPDHLIPLGKAKVVRPGRDVTVVSYSKMLHDALAAAESLTSDGIEAEVIDLRTVAPLDRETVLQSLKKTHRLLIAHQGAQDFGVGSELAALAANEGFWYLDAPVTRVAPPAMPTPYAPSLEHEWLPNTHDIADAIRRTVEV